jgi:hypothetical protein
MARLATGPSRHALNLAYILLIGGAMLVSPAIGALLLPSLGAVPLVLADAVTFGVAAALFLSVPAIPGAAAQRVSPLGAAFGGFAAVMRQRTLRVIFVGAFSATATIIALQAALPALASERLGSSADAGLLYASVGLGSVGGSLLALWRPLRRPQVILPGVAAEIAGAGLLAIIGPPAADLVVLTLSTAAASLAQVEGGVLIQSQAPATVGRIQGAVSTSRFLGMAGGATLALLLAPIVTWQILVFALGLGGLVLLGVSALGRQTGAEAAGWGASTSPLGDIPD